MISQEDNEQIVELSIRARGLKNKNNIYISNTICSVYKVINDVNGVFIGSTEVIKHNLNPNWKETVKFHYQFYKKQTLQFIVQDADKSSIGQIVSIFKSGVQLQNFIGSCQINAAKLVGSQNGETRVQLMSHDKQKTSGTLVICIDKINRFDQATVIQWCWGAEKLLRKNWLGLGKSDPFAIFSSYTQNNQHHSEYQTEVHKKSINPIWNSWKIDREKLCKYHKYFQVEVWDYNSIGGHDFIGEAQINLNDILNNGQYTFNLQTKKNKPAGSLYIKQIQITQPQIVNKENTFLDYLMGGWQFGMIAGVDFTFSNGPLDRFGSLHQLSADRLNYYEMALDYIGSVLLSFNVEKKVQFFGFGGIPKLPNYNKSYMDDCFPINGNKDDPNVIDIDGIMQTYRYAVPLIEFSGPTFVCNLLKNMLEITKQNANRFQYTVSIILTDGQIEDMQEALNIIANFSLLPASLIIVGIGDDDFKSMKKLCDLNLVNQFADSNMKDKIRDIVQFVAIMDYEGNIELLSEKILQKLPIQIMEYMNLNKIKPLKQQLKKQFTQFEDEIDS